MQIKPCTICGASVKVAGDPELVACESKACINTIENHIGLHYDQAAPVHADYARPGSDTSAIGTFKNGKLVSSVRILPVSEYFKVEQFNGSIHINHGSR